VQAAALTRETFVERLHDVGALLARSFDMVEGCLRRRAVGPGARVVIAFQQSAQRLETYLWEQHLGHALAHAEPVLVARVARQPVRVRPLDAVHPPGIFGLGTIEEARRGATRGAFEVVDFQRVEVDILGKGNPGLTPKAHALEGHAVRAVRMRGDDKAAGLTNEAVGGQNIGCRADLRAAVGDALDGNAQAQQEQFKLA